MRRCFYLMMWLGNGDMNTHDDTLVMPNYKPRVFVVGSNIAAGGTNMAYHLGCIIHKYWDYQPVNVIIDGHNDIHSTWDYPVKFDQIEMSKVNQIACKDDIIIANPSFSKFQLGLGFPGKKIMYVQGCNTFTVLDGFFDKYVAVSPFVQKNMKDIYDLDMPIIPPFIHLNNMPEESIAWSDREEMSVVTMLKWEGEALLGYFKKLMNERYPQLKYKLKVIPKGTIHKDVLYEMSKNRYFLWLSQIEGFGLPPIEAMINGCTVIGFHAGGGLSYFKDNYNASIFTYPNFEGVAKSFNHLLNDPVKSQELANNAKNVGGSYTYENFVSNWKNELKSLIGQPLLNVT